MSDACSCVVLDYSCGLCLPLRDQLASIRGQETSAAHAAASTLMLQTPEAMAEFLEACACASRPAAEQQLKRMRAALSDRRTADGQEQEADSREVASAAPVACAAALSQIPGEETEIAPWDLAFAQQLLLGQHFPLVSGRQASSSDGSPVIITLKGAVKVSRVLFFA